MLVLRLILFSIDLGSMNTHFSHAKHVLYEETRIIHSEYTFVVE